MSWTAQEIENYCKNWAAKNGFEFDCPVKINGRLTKTLGRLISKPTPFGYEPDRLEISKRVVEYAADDDLIAVINHELCHWAVLIETNEVHGHDSEFKAMCRRVGCPHDTPNINIKFDINDDQLYKYIVKCTECDNKLFYSRAGDVVKHPDFYACGKCGSKLEVIQNW